MNSNEIYGILTELITESWAVLGQMAPYLLFGFLVAGILSVYVSPEWVERHLGGRGFAPIVKASVFGVPLPLCSCGVIPVSASIRRHGASRAATTAFLLSTPQTGVDSIAVTYALLGPVFAVFRPLAALATGLAGGVLVRLFDATDGANTEEEPKPGSCTEECCSGDRKGNAFMRALRYGFGTLPHDIGPALLVGILIAGAMAALIPEKYLATYIGGGIFSILLIMAAGVPVYVCATASVPIAAGLMHMGASPGAALAFLIAGPATNAATFTTIWKVLGRRTAGLFIFTVAASALGCGLLLDLLIPAAEKALPQLAGHAHTLSQGNWLSHASAIALLAVLAYSYKSFTHHHSSEARGKEEKARDDVSSRDNFLELQVTGMTCSLCADSVRRAVAECDGVRSVEVNLARGLVTVAGDNLDPQRLYAAVAGLGYQAQVQRGQ
ncbi:MAG: SO_0444 family Cu/Zn efflux transporter [Gemmatimonadota bacterium]|nr:SO_0444 family Cu/Zn efflux transporter [Gemmatimonadota bacterium]